VGGKYREKRHEKRQFSTVTCELRALADWLRACGVTHVAMESTGVCWKPVWHVLEGHCEPLLVNAQHVKAIPGKKTGRRDSVWPAQLLQHGLVKSSFVPPTPIRELRDLTRYRVTLCQECNRIASRIQKGVEDANVKLASVATDPLGASGRAMLKALIAGEEDTTKLADLARELLRRKIPALEAALDGRVAPQHRFLLLELLEHLEFVEAKIGRLETTIEERQPFDDVVRRLCPISWYRPGERLGNLSALFRRLAGRRGVKRASIAVAHAILTIAYRVIRDGTAYRDLGPDYFDTFDPARPQRTLVKRLEGLGFHVTLAAQPLPAEEYLRRYFRRNGG
jgi:hypothetical protein